MGSVNKVILLGNLGADPEIKYLTSGQPVCNIRLATTEKWRDKNEQMQERTEWHRIVVYGKQAENAAKYLAKGRQVYVEGKIQTRSWDDKEGKKQYMVEVVANELVYVGGAAGGGGSEKPAQSKPTSSPKPADVPADDFGPLDDDSIPF